MNIMEKDVQAKTIGEPRSGYKNAKRTFNTPVKRKSRDSSKEEKGNSRDTIIKECQVKSSQENHESERSKGKPRDMTIDEPKVKAERDENRRMREAKETVKLKAKRWNDEPNVEVKVKERGMEESGDKII
ncbi:uncharacterized protein HD556DRAFT_1315010 [Suillus plorans]|uniref:Uncharacterized protein n=1 Tax=Suillus plorans TaxID=116603 RepID=A0A9P7A8J7_9AGAM|nr:uncharacterized protein HD556DRAFT_1315010 [Suillus plorans]KAG1784495.1 hypothetical protein HD556DRAFT_1315010 [Suillus plorans]